MALLIVVEEFFPELSFGCITPIRSYILVGAVAGLGGLEELDINLFKCYDIFLRERPGYHLRHIRLHQLFHHLHCHWHWRHIRLHVHLLHPLHPALHPLHPSLSLHWLHQRKIAALFLFTISLCLIFLDLLAWEGAAIKGRVGTTPSPLAAETLLNSFAFDFHWSGRNSSVL